MFLVCFFEKETEINTSAGDWSVLRMHSVRFDQEV